MIANGCVFVNHEGLAARSACTGAETVPGSEMSLPLCWHSQAASVRSWNECLDARFTGWAGEAGELALRVGFGEINRGGLRLSRIWVQEYNTAQRLRKLGGSRLDVFMVYHAGQIGFGVV